MATRDPAVHVWPRTTVDRADEMRPRGRVQEELRQRVEVWNAEGHA